MTMDNNTRMALVVFGTGIVIYFLFKDSKYFGADKTKKEQNRVPVPEPVVNPKDLKKNKKANNGLIALKAYIDAYNNREPDKVLEELNREFAKELKVRVYKRSSDNSFVVSDLSGNVIMVNKN